jgi:hypothetical protein
MTLIAIHQPNYLPWLGFFSKISQSDVFIFLDDAQYTKNSYINRVSTLCQGRAKWLTIPIRVPLGTAICSARPANGEWVTHHLECLANYYRKAPARQEVLCELKTMFGLIETTADIASINMKLIRALASRFGIAAEFRVASHFHCSEKRSNERLIALVRSIDEHGTYLSGAGASAYQNPDLFHSAGLNIKFSSFTHPVYVQSDGAFVTGLSAIDAVFWLGWEATGALIRQQARLQ